MCEGGVGLCAGVIELYVEMGELLMCVCVSQLFFQALFSMVSNLLEANLNSVLVCCKANLNVGNNCTIAMSTIHQYIILCMLVEAGDRTNVDVVGEVVELP